MMDVMVPYVFLTTYSTHMPKLGVLVFDPTREHDMGFCKLGLGLSGLKL